MVCGSGGPSQACCPGLPQLPIFQPSGPWLSQVWFKGAQAWLRLLVSTQMVNLGSVYMVLILQAQQDERAAGDMATTTRISKDDGDSLGETCHRLGASTEQKCGLKSLQRVPAWALHNGAMAAGLPPNLQNCRATSMQCQPGRTLGLRL